VLAIMTSMESPRAGYHMTCEERRAPYIARLMMDAEKDGQPYTVRGAIGLVQREGCKNRRRK